MKNIKLDIPSKFIPILRHIVQTIYVIFSLWVGLQFYYFFMWATGQSNHFVPRPAAVEAFLPISALVALKQFLLTGIYDPVHPAGLTIFIAIVTSALLWRKGFCGWVCPVGAISNLVEKLGRKMKAIVQLPTWLDIPLLGGKYLLLGFFLYLILWKMDLEQVKSFLTSPYNMTVDARMLQFFMDPSRLSLTIIISLILISLFVRNFWCRYLCPYGAFLGLVALLSPIQIRRDPELCKDCKVCEGACPSSIKITRKETIRTVECIGCMECVASCKVSGCLTPALIMGPKKVKKIPLITIPLGTVATILIFWLVAKATGHWNTHIPPEVFKRLYEIQLIF